MYVMGDEETIEESEHGSIILKQSIFDVVGIDNRCDGIGGGGGNDRNVGFERGVRFETDPKDGLYERSAGLYKLSNWFAVLVSITISDFDGSVPSSC